VQAHVAIFERNPEVSALALSKLNMPGSALVCRVVVTPTCAFLLPPIPMKQSRLLRAFASTCCRSATSMASASRARPKSEDAVFQRVHACLERGVFVHRFHFTLVASSSSQRKDLSAMFVLDDPALAETIRGRAGWRRLAATP
jgi:hypothetical protein